MMVGWQHNIIRIFETWEEDLFGEMRLYIIYEYKNGDKWKRKLYGPIPKEEYFLQKLADKL